MSRESIHRSVAPPKDIEITFGISGKFIARINVCSGATVGTFNTVLKGQHFRIVHGMQYVSEEGLAHKASELERRVFEGYAEINNKQFWSIVFLNFEEAARAK